MDMFLNTSVRSRRLPMDLSVILRGCLRGSLLFFIVLLVPSSLYSQVGKEIAKVFSLKGVVEVRSGGDAGSWVVVEKGTLLHDGDEVRTAKGARVGLKFNEGKLLRLRENTYLKVQAPTDEAQNGKVDLVTGVIHLFSREKGGSPAVDTRDVSAAIRGTEVVFEKTDNDTKVVVLEGNVELANAHGQVELGKGEQGKATENSAPTKSIIVNPEKEVQWALYYPLLDNADAGVAGQKPSALGRIDTMIAAGEVSSAEKELDVITDASLSDEVLVRRAIVAVIQNQQEAALRHIEGVHSYTSKSALARSYVHQSLRQLELAKEWALKSVHLDPHNGLAWARLAELELGFGNLKESQDYATKAISLSSQNSYVHSVMGFVNLTQGEIEEARSSFERAVNLDSEDGTPRMGLGLVKVRQGDLSGGREEFEVAAGLEPSRGLYRSYLGKAFFESEDEESSDKEYDRAIALDPNDPTPYLYRAFSRLAENRVVEALGDVEDSISRNNNRAVYRSSMLLDQDSSVRSTSLAEVFQQLGFSRIAQLEAMKSIGEDYTNFGAHRLLSQSYEGDFYKDTQFTEDTVADIMAPLSLNVFQGLSGYSSDASFNEYAALFDRDQTRTGLNTSWASFDDQANANFFNIGKTGPLGYYAGYKTLYARGSKSNGDYARLHRFDLAGQYQISSTDRVLSKVSYTSSDDQVPSVGAASDDFAASVASHHILSAGFELITRFEYFKRNYDAFNRNTERRLQTFTTVDDVASMFSDNVVGVSERDQVDTKTYSYGAQLIRDYGNFSWVLGSDFFNINGSSDDQSYVTLDPTGVYQGATAPLNSASSYNSFSHSSYLYTTWNAASWVDLNLGGNYTGIELPQYDVIAPYLDGTRKENLFSPKLGFSLYPEENTTVRGAYFKGLGSPNIVSPGGIEPTLVGSFSQKFGDLPGAKSETYGIGVDHKIPKKAYFGAEYLYRDLSRELVDVTNQVNLDFDTLSERVSYQGVGEPNNKREHIVRAYSYHIMSDRWSFTSDYAHWNLNDVSLNGHNILNKGMFSLNYFDTSRWFGFLRTTIRNQDLKNRVGFNDGETTFTLHDIGIGYRLAHRHGAIRAVLRNLTGENNFQYEDRGREAPVYSGFNAGIEASVNF